MEYSKKYFQKKYPFIQFLSSDYFDLSRDDLISDNLSGYYNPSEFIQLTDENEFLLLVNTANIKTAVIHCDYDEIEPIIIEKDAIKDYFAEFRDYEPYNKRKCKFVDFPEDANLFEEYYWEYDKEFEKQIIQKSIEWNKQALANGSFTSINITVGVRYNNQWITLNCSTRLGSQYDFTTSEGAIIHLIETFLPQYILEKKSKH